MTGTGFRPDLVLFTAKFPFDGAESVLGWELDTIAERFERIFIIPSERGTELRSLPANAQVVDLGWGRWSRAEKTRALRSASTLAVLAETFSNPESWRFYVSAGRWYLDILAINLLKAQSLTCLIRGEDLHEALFYDYWFENTTLALAVLRARRIVRCAVCRAHRFDVYDHSWPQLGRVPFRDFKLRFLDRVFPISDDAERYLRAKAARIRPGRRSGPDKIQVARLGVPATSVHAIRTPDVPVVVSCAALWERKQAHRIPDVLSACDIPLHWVHFGDGPERERVETAAGALPDRVSWDLRGSVENEEVRAFYAENRVAAFLSMSESEGIPVSMMEAQSYGIPIVSLLVGGIGELVTEKTGLTLPPTATARQIATALRAVIQSDDFRPDEIRAAFMHKFAATANYPAFADSIIDLWTKLSQDE